MVAPSPSQRSFSLDDQRAFAELSGDHNVLHLDPIEARRLLFGHIAVHGVHVLLWALNEVCASDPNLRSLTRIRAHFDAPIAPGEKIFLTWHVEGSVVRGQAKVDRKTIMRVTLASGGDLATQVSETDRIEQLACADPDFSEPAHFRGATRLTLTRSWRKMFPALATQFAAGQVAVMLAATRIVGMICPGRHSIFSGLNLDFGNEEGSAEWLSFSLRRFDPRVSLVDLDVASQGVRGVLHAFRRPAPIRQTAFSSLAGRVTPLEFAGQRAIVIGGSRGIGETTAKLLAAGGADVTITFAQGAEEARRIVAEVRGLGLRIRARHFNVLSSEERGSAALISHLYYFATPRIPMGVPGRFDSTKFSILVDYYLSGLARCANWLVERAAPCCTLWVPSTVFLETDSPRFPEYVAAKACVESLCQQLGKALPQVTFVHDRLPALPSDQTQSLTKVELADPVDILLPILRRHSRCRE